MTLFSFKAIGKDGVPYENVREANDRFSLYQDIKKEGGAVVSVQIVGQKKFWNFLKSLATFGTIKTHDKIIFARNLSSMLEAGLSVSRALSIMEKQASNRKLKKIFSTLAEEISKGITLSESMKSFPDMFSSLFVSMAKAGEESGNLVGSLKVVASQMEKSYALTRKIRGAMMYPAIIFMLMFAIGILMLVYIVPTLTATFKDLNVDLPFSTKVIIFISDFLRNNLIICAISLVIFVVIIIALFKSKKGKRFLDYCFLKLPVIGMIIKEINSARTARTLSSLLISGVDMVVAIGITKDVLQNSFYKDVLEKAEKVVQKGDPLSTVFEEREDLYPLFVGEMANVGEETGKLAEMLSNIATFYEDEVDQKTKDMSTIIEPVLMVFIGVAVGFFAISMLTPMYSLADKI